VAVLAVGCAPDYGLYYHDTWVTGPYESQAVVPPPPPAVAEPMLPPMEAPPVYAPPPAPAVIYEQPVVVTPPPQTTVVVQEYYTPPPRPVAFGSYVPRPIIVLCPHCSSRSCRGECRRRPSRPS